MAGENQNQGQGQGQGNEQPFEITGDDLTGWVARLSTGQVYKGKNQQELLNEVVKGQLNSSMTLQQKEQQLQESRRVIEEHEQRNREYQESQQRNQNQGQGQGQGDGQLSREQINRRYWELINTDPVAAEEFMAQVYWGVENPRASFQKSAIVSEYVADSVASREFLRDNPDFPANDNNSDKLLKELFNRDLEITSFNLERVWKDLKRSNTIEPLSAQQIQDEQKQLRRRAQEMTSDEEVTEDVATMQGQGKGYGPPPSPTGGRGRTKQEATQIGDDELNRFATMSRADREKILREKGLM